MRHVQDVIVFIVDLRVVINDILSRIYLRII